VADTGTLRPVRILRAPLRGLAQDESWRRRLLVAGSATGYGIGVAALWLLVRENGGLGYDSYAYWLAGRNVLEGQPLYWPHAEGALGAFRYPPLFAQLWAPFAVLPALVFSWLWRIVCLLSLRYLAGSWRNVGLWMLVPLTLTELSIANVTFPVAAMTVMALQGRAWMASWAGAIKIGPLLAMPYLWLVRPNLRRSLVIGLIALLVAIGISFVLSPQSWQLYVQALTWMSVSGTESFGVIAIVPNGLADVLLRLGLGVVLVVVAVRRRSDRVVFTATIIAVPVLAIWRLVPLLALPRLGRKS
jgi:hypothetical protein